MLCEECGIREANVRFTTISGGKSYEKMLCAQCLAKHKQELLDGISLGDLMAGFLKEEQNGEAPAEGLRCPGCGMAYEEFKSKGRLAAPSATRPFPPSWSPVLAACTAASAMRASCPRACGRRPATRTASVP